MNTQIGPLCGASNFLGIMFNKLPSEVEVDARFYMILENYPYGNWKWIAFGFAQDMFLSYEQRARKTVLRIAIERDLSLKQIITKRK